MDMFIDSIRTDRPQHQEKSQKGTSSQKARKRGRSPQEKKASSQQRGKGSSSPKGPKEKKSSSNASSQKTRISRRPSSLPEPSYMKELAHRRQEKIPPVPAGKLRIIPLGGQEEVGRNMAVFEYGNDIVIIDMGMQFAEEDMPGIDYIVPNISYLKGKEKRIRGVIFTHGHLDHIGAAPVLLSQLGYPPIIGRDLTVELIKKKVEDYEPGMAERLKIIRVRSLEKTLKLGSFEAGFFDVEHSIMDAVGVVLKSPAGTVIHLGDWTIGHDPVDNKIIRYDHLASLPQPTILMLESLGATNYGKPKSEKEVQRNLEKLITEAPGRVIIGTFSSQVKRIVYLLRYAEKLGKKVAFDGYSMRTNVEIAKRLGYLKVKKDTIIPIQEIDRYPDNKIVIICTGAQGETNAVLNRIVTDNHQYVKLKKSDTIVFSSSVIPGNERSVQRLKDNLYRKCDHVIHSDIMDIHMSGHSVASDIQEILKQIKPTFFLPVYANHYFLKEAAKLATAIGYPERNIFVLDNGHIFEVSRDGKARVRKEKADTSYVFVDGLGVGDVGHVVLRDRQLLSADGMFVVTVILDSKTKEIVGNIQVTSRGFIVVKENFDLVNEAKKRVAHVVKKTTSRQTRIDWKDLENAIRDDLGQFFFQKTQRRPMILPVVIEV